MIRILIIAIIFGLIGLAVIFMVIVNFTYKGVKKLREEAEEHYYHNQKYKEQKERNPFGGDYFKGGQGRRQSRTQAQYEERENPKREKNPFGDDYFKGSGGRQEQTQQKTKNNTARKTTTSSGVTIIDGRDSEDKRKIFDHSDGEYVEFEEV